MTVELDGSRAGIERVRAIGRNSAIDHVEAESVMKVLPQTVELHPGEGKLTRGLNRFERDGTSPRKRFVLTQLCRKGIRIVTARFRSRVLPGMVYMRGAGTAITG